MDEKRKSTRHRVLKAGKIAFSGAVVDCTVRNLSETGAALDIVSSVGIPDHFTLIIAVDRVQKSCRVAWRKATRIGVHFG
jgi:hypothetical protein